MTGCPHFPTITAQGLDPDPLLDELRVTDPITRVQLPFGEPCWLLTRYDDVRSMLADPRFSRAATIGEHGLPLAQVVIPLRRPLRPRYAPSSPGRARS